MQAECGMAWHGAEGEKMIGEHGIQRSGATCRRGRQYTVVLCQFAALLLLAWARLPATALSPGKVRREFYDPNLGSHWQLVVDLRHPGWPGKLVLLKKGDGQSATRAMALKDGQSQATSPSQPIRLALPAAIAAAIRPGDQVTVDQETPSLRARLQAVALESGSLGQRVRVRLTAGADAQQGLYGKVIVAIATGVREARWLGSEGSRP